ncbi:hypothetical protein LQG66_03310 [Bradyrhizobium ontarionense]|uniref:DUF6894 domain-containing protein n=1 Tax=Bradyrhizobium ontarionense TaxID=2898149 RepID=A0ABY3RD66_9BRAD|nr:hypothetical protein [Bradyrhizobium sp. A19]UFZ05364.1 hypothetical protein LQG66_03310 [Bradyrhizobium sp. A19]
MAQVFFHCSNDDEFLIDRRGTSVLDLTEARDHAARVVHTLISTEGGEDWRDWVLHISDDLGEEIFTMPFSSMLGRMH